MTTTGTRPISGRARPSVGKGSRRWEASNRPPEGQPWTWFSREMLESAAWRAMSLNARRIVDRVVLEHMAHAGTMNGALVVTNRDFRAAGVSGKYLTRSIEEATALGFVDVIENGRGGVAGCRRPSVYAVGWLPTVDGAVPRNRWKRIVSQKQAADLVERCRSRRQRAAFSIASIAA